MMHAPPKSNLQHGEVVLLSSLLQHRERLECCISEVSGSVVLSGVRFCTKAREWVFGIMVFRLDLSGEETAGDGIVNDNRDAVSMASSDQLDIQVPGYMDRLSVKIKRFDMVKCAH